MFAFDCAKARACGRRGLCAAVLSSCVLLGACANSKQPAGPQVFAWLQPTPSRPSPVFVASAPVEDEGLPAQFPPSPIGRPDDGSAAVFDTADEGLPIPKSPEEAGIEFTTCGGWSCAR